MEAAVAAVRAHGDCTGLEPGPIFVEKYGYDTVCVRYRDWPECYYTGSEEVVVDKDGPEAAIGHIGGDRQGRYGPACGRASWLEWSSLRLRLGSSVAGSDVTGGADAQRDTASMRRPTTMTKKMIVAMISLDYLLQAIHHRSVGTCSAASLGAFRRLPQR
jgi:hypothetical protein